MIVPIEIDSQDILSQYSLSKEEIEGMFDNIAKSLGTVYASKLENEAINGLNSTRRRYIQNIRIIDSGKLESTVMLDYSKDPLVRMIEEGQSAFDMKVYFLRSSKVKVSKSGKRYLTIPFRFSTSGAVGESEVFSGKMPSEVYDIVRKKEVGVNGKSQGITKNELSNLPSKFQVVSKRQEVKDSEGKMLFKEYEHKSSIYQGIQKQVDKVTGQSSYHSFRRVSELSDEDSFIHTGIQARHFMQRAKENMNIPEEVGVQIDNELAKLGF